MASETEELQSRVQHLDSEVCIICTCRRILVFRPVPNLAPVVRAHTVIERGRITSQHFDTLQCTMTSIWAEVPPTTHLCACLVHIVHTCMPSFIMIKHTTAIPIAKPLKT